MSDAAQVARAAYHSLVSGTPPTADTETKETTAGAWRRAERVHRAVDELEDWWRREAHALSEHSIIGYGDPTGIVQSTTDQDAMSGLVETNFVPAARTRLVLNHPVVYGRASDFLQGAQPATAHLPTFVTTTGPVYSLADLTAAAFPGQEIGDLREALADLDTLGEEARQEGLPEPDAEAIENARTLLPRLFSIHPVRYRVSPTERRGVAIDAPMRRGAAVGVECAPDDTVYCFAAIDGNSRRAKFYQMDGLPDVFIAKALHDLAAG